ncbi:MAG: hypothetical protein H6Q56_1585 [Deltaproteobacteria bacterium]|nr:hypothetical protein [Deltaproteobacteria bacterium]
MLRLLQSIFGSASQGRYPESLVTEAIERAVDGTDPGLRAVSGYRKKLRPAVICAIDHVIALVEALPTPMPVRFAAYSDDSRLKGFFISAADLKNVFTKDRSLADFLQGPAGDATQIFALLAMEKQERGTFGAELSGDIVIRDVPKVTVSFDAHRLLDPTADEVTTRRLLMRRAYDHLLSLALKRLAFVKSERIDLERRRTLLQAKLNLLEREGWGFDAADPGEKISAATLEERLGELETQLQEFGGDDREHEAYLQIVADLLGKPEEYLLAKSETIFVNRMGFKQSEASSDAPELTFTDLRNAEGRSLVAVLVSLQGEELRNL